MAGQSFLLQHRYARDSPTLLVLIVSLLCPCCKEDDRKWTPSTPPLPPAAEKLERVASPEPDDSRKKDTRPRTDLSEEKLSRFSPWGLGKRRKLGPSGPVSAVPDGAIFITRDNRLLKSERKGADDFVPVTETSASFAPYGRGPSVSPSYAYWTSEKGELFRARLQDARVQKLLDGAQANTRTSVIHQEGRDVVAFIKEVDDKAMAFLWADRGNETGEVLQVSPDGSTASSVVLLPGSPHLRVVILAGRTSMSPVHVRRLRVRKSRLELKEDQVIWVGPGSNSFTEIHALERPGGAAIAFLPTAKDFSDFGLAQLSLNKNGGEIREPSWHIYPNGLDPAPVATGHFCDDDYLLYARPKGKKPYSAQELHLVSVSEKLPGEGKVLARARKFNDLSLAPTKTGAIVVWTAGSATRGMVLSCPESSKPLDLKGGPASPVKGQP